LRLHAASDEGSWKRMATTRVFLDHNAGAPLIEEARDAMLVALAAGGNASSVHGEGRAARKLVEAARRDVAALCNARPEHVVFTSGATEAANLLLSPRWTMGRAPLAFGALYVNAADHPATLSGGRFDPSSVIHFGVDASGVARLDELQKLLAAHDRGAGLPLVAIHAANNETGVLQPIADIARIVHAAGGVLVVDAAQAAGRIPLDISAGSADFMILSSHKLGGPQGAGAVVGRADLMMPLPLLRGGGQERGFRGGTENVAAIAGFGAAARVARARLGDMAGVRALRDRLEADALAVAPGAVVAGADAARLANTSCLSLPGIRAETALIAFDVDGVAVSAGAACSSGKVGPSHVLKAMGVAGDAGAIRVSLGRATTAADIDRFVAVLRLLVARGQARVRAA
jgi:cysteine desulfurase